MVYSAPTCFVVLCWGILKKGRDFWGILKKTVFFGGRTENIRFFWGILKKTVFFGGRTKNMRFFWGILKKIVYFFGRIKNSRFFWGILKKIGFFGAEQIVVFILIWFLILPQWFAKIRILNENWGRLGTWRNIIDSLILGQIYKQNEKIEKICPAPIVSSAILPLQ